MQHKLFYANFKETSQQFQCFKTLDYVFCACDIFPCGYEKSSKWIMVEFKLSKPVVIFSFCNKNNFLGSKIFRHNVSLKDN